MQKHVTPSFLQKLIYPRRCSTPPRKPRSLSRPGALCLALSAIVFGSLPMAGSQSARAEEEQNYHWYAYSSGNMLISQANESGPELSRIEKLTFNATAKLPGDYWVGAGVALSKPKPHNLVEFYARKKTSQDRPVELRIVDSGGRAGYYQITVKSDWTKFDLRREKPIHTDGGPSPEEMASSTPQDIAKVEVILNNNWFAAGDTWVLEIAGLKTQSVDAKSPIGNSK